MRLIYTKDGFTKNEKEEWRVIIFNNILDGLRMCIDAMEEFKIDFEYDNTTVRLTARVVGTIEQELTLPAGPSASNYARERPPSLRADPDRIPPSLQGHVEGPGHTKSNRERKRVRVARQSQLVCLLGDRDGNGDGC